MNWMEHEYLIPIFLGNSNYVIRCAKAIKKKTGISPHIFADSFSIYQRMIFNCHKVSPLKFEFLTESLVRFASELEKYKFPVIIQCDDMSAQYIAECGETIESYCLAVKYFC